MTEESARRCILRQWRPRHREAGRYAPSAERSGLPEMETVRSEPPGHGAHLAFVCFQCDFLGQHNVADWQTTNRHET
jgi:hypothetical protein